jgi:hypothetical protein
MALKRTALPAGFLRRLRFLVLNTAGRIVQYAQYAQYARKTFVRLAALVGAVIWVCISEVFPRAYVLKGKA